MSKPFQAQTDWPTLLAMLMIAVGSALIGLYLGFSSALMVCAEKGSLKLAVFNYPVTCTWDTSKAKDGSLADTIDIQNGPLRH